MQIELKKKEQAKVEEENKKYAAKCIEKDEKEREEEARKAKERQERALDNRKAIERQIETKKAAGGKDKEPPMSDAEMKINMGIIDKIKSDPQVVQELKKKIVAAKSGDSRPVTENKKPSGIGLM